MSLFLCYCPETQVTIFLVLPSLLFCLLYSRVHWDNFSTDFLSLSYSSLSLCVLCLQSNLSMTLLFVCTSLVMDLRWVPMMKRVKVEWSPFKAPCSQFPPHQPYFTPQLSLTVISLSTHSTNNLTTCIPPISTAGRRNYDKETW